MRTLVLTRPLPAARRFAQAIRARGVAAPILFSPVLRIEAEGEGPLPGGTLVFTSENGVEAARTLGPLTGRTVVAVGPRTGAAAQRAGAVVEVLGGDVSRLAASLATRGARTAYTHLHGSHVAGDLVGILRTAGLDARSRTIYRQEAVPLTAAARTALLSQQPCVLPLFSPRSAQLVAQSLDGAPREIRVLAFSRRIADHWPWDAEALGAQTPDMADMLDRVAALVAAPAAD